MALHPNFTESPYDLLRPDHRWFPAAEELRATAYEKLLPPLVANIRTGVCNWRETAAACDCPACIGVRGPIPWLG